MRRFGKNEALAIWTQHISDDKRQSFHHFDPCFKHRNVKEVVGASSAFAAICQNGSVVTWGTSTKVYGFASLTQRRVLAS